MSYQISSINFLSKNHRHNEKADPTSMQKLMGGEYGREWQTKIDSLTLNDKSTKPAMDAGQRYGNKS